MDGETFYRVYYGVFEDRADAAQELQLRLARRVQVQATEEKSFWAWIRNASDAPYMPKEVG